MLQETPFVRIVTGMIQKKFVEKRIKIEEIWKFKIPTTIFEGLWQGIFTKRIITVEGVAVLKFSFPYLQAVSSISTISSFTEGSAVSGNVRPSVGGKHGSCFFFDRCLSNRFKAVFKCDVARYHPWLACSSSCGETALVMTWSSVVIINLRIQTTPVFKPLPSRMKTTAPSHCSYLRN